MHYHWLKAHSDLLGLQEAFQQVGKFEQFHVARFVNKSATLMVETLVTQTGNAASTVVATQPNEPEPLFYILVDNRAPVEILHGAIEQVRLWIESRTPTSPT